MLSWRVLVGLGQARHGEAGKARPGEVRSGASRLGGAGYGRARQARWGEVRRRRGAVWQAWQAGVRCGEACFGRRGMANPGLVRHRMARRGTVEIVGRKERYGEL